MMLRGRRRPNRASPLLWVVLTFGYAFVLAPILVTIVFSFNQARFSVLPWSGFSLRWYHLAFSSPATLASLRNSISVGLALAATAVVLGFLGAYGLARWQTRLQQPISLVLLSPLAVPWLFLGLGLLIFLTGLGVPRSLVTVYLGHTVFAVPLATLIIRARLSTLPISQEEAAWNLGARPWQGLLYVVLPQTWPGIAAAFLLVFTLSFDEFIMAWFLSGFDVTLPVHIWGKIRSGIDPTISAIGSVIFVGSISLAVTAQFLIRRTTNAR